MENINNGLIHTFNQSKRKNTILYYLSFADLLGLVLLAIYAKWEEAGMSFSKILLLQGFFGLFILLMEFPSGVLSDLYERKKVLMVAHFSAALALYLYMIGETWTIFMIAEFCFAVALSFKSGTLNAFVYDTYLEENDQQGADDVLSKGFSMRMFVNFLSLVVSGFLYAYNKYLGFYLLISFHIGMLILFSQAEEPKRLKSDSSKDVLLESVGFLKDRRILMVLVLTLMVAVSLRVVFWAYIPKMKTVGLDVEYIALVLALANLISFVGSLLAKRLTKNSTSAIFVSVTGFVGVGLFMFDHLSILLLAILFNQITRGSVGVLRRVVENRVATSNVRASVGSLLSTLSSLVYFSFSGITDLMGMSLNLVLLANTILSGLFLIVVLGLNADLSNTKPTSQPNSVIVSGD